MQSIISNNDSHIQGSGGGDTFIFTFPMSLLPCTSNQGRSIWPEQVKLKRSQYHEYIVKSLPKTRYEQTPMTNCSPYFIPLINTKTQDFLCRWKLDDMSNGYATCSCRRKTCLGCPPFGCTGHWGCWCCCSPSHGSHAARRWSPQSAGLQEVGQSISTFMNHPFNFSWLICVLIPVN